MANLTIEPPLVDLVDEEDEPDPTTPGARRKRSGVKRPAARPGSDLPPTVLLQRSEIMSGVDRTRIDTQRNLLDVLDKIAAESGGKAGGVSGAVAPAAYALDRGIDLSPYGSWTLKGAPQQGGVEPDECYIVGADQSRERPDLAIEVVWTSGGIGFGPSLSFGTQPHSTPSLVISQAICSSLRPSYFQRLTSAATCASTPACPSPNGQVAFPFMLARSVHSF
jgi:hypothetical protein